MALHVVRLGGDATPRRGARHGEIPPAGEARELAVRCLAAGVGAQRQAAAEVQDDGNDLDDRSSAGTDRR